MIDMVKIRVKQVIECYVDIESPTKVGATRIMDSLNLEPISMTEPGTVVRRYKKKSKFYAVECVECGEFTNSCWKRHDVCWSCRNNPNLVDEVTIDE